MLAGSRKGRPGYVVVPVGGKEGGGRAEWEAKGMGEKGEETERGIAPLLLNDF